MKTDITSLLIVFDELLKFPTNEELGVYWFEKKRSNGMSITLAFSIYEEYTSVIICDKNENGIATISMKNCSKIRVLDEKRGCLEIVHDTGKGRCFLSLLEGTILRYEEEPDLINS